MRGGDLALAGDLGKSEPAFVPQSGERLDRAAGAGVLGGADDVQGLGAGVFAEQVGGVIVVIAHPDRRFAQPHQFAHFRAARRAELQVDRRIADREVFEDFRQRRTGQRADGGERYRPRVAGPQRAHGVLGILYGRERTLRIRQEDPPRLAEHDPARRPLEQRRSELLLQKTDAPRDRRLRAMQHLRRLRETLLAVNREEGGKRFGVHERVGEGEAAR